MPSLNTFSNIFLGNILGKWENSYEIGIFLWNWENFYGIAELNGSPIFLNLGT